MTERKKLIEELEFMTKDSGDTCFECIADFILADRKRIVKPLVKFKNKGYSGGTFANNAIDQTLKLAGYGGGEK